MTCKRQGTPFRLCTWRVRTFPGPLDGDIGVALQPYALLLQQDVRRRHRGAGGQPPVMHIRIPDYDFLYWQCPSQSSPRKKKAAPVAGVGEDFCIFWEKFHDITEHPKVNIGGPVANGKN